ncbi:MAG TPA: aminoglycoside 6-adenylyltransferase [Mobilitalea sp.]|nr:aminoglycoside 6-adenylyltransferase [Mobilitalea sp.]
MHADLEMAFDKVVDILQKDLRCKGGWHYGSIGRGMSDIYSDYDPVFLVADIDFEEFALDVPGILRQACDDLLIFWGECFNDSHFKNYCSVMKINDKLHQFDFFILNSDYPEEWMCKQHLKDCTRENIIFDRTGEVGELLDKGYRTDNNIPDVVRAMDTYWLHTEMLIKYFKRNDIFKLIKNFDMIFHAHIDLLLGQYDTLDWGAWESKVKYCVPEEKQAHLLQYFCAADLDSMAAAMKRCLPLFLEDMKDACQAKGIEYPERIAKEIMDYFHRMLP